MGWHRGDCFEGRELDGCLRELEVLWVQLWVQLWDPILKTERKGKNVMLTKHFANTFQGEVCSFGAPSGTRWNYKIMVFNCEWLQLFSLSDPYLYNLLTTADKSDCPNKQMF